MKFRGACALPLWHPALLLASGFGIGFMPLMPGSWASLAALVGAWFAARLGGTSALLVGAALLFLAGWWSAGVVTRASPIADPPLIVIDEAAGQWLALVPAGRSIANYALAFLLFRVFDIWKPWPIGWVDRNLKGGFGVMLDDTLAAGYALVFLLLARASLGRLGVRF